MRAKARELHNTKTRELYSKLRQGAKVHSKAVGLFGETPEKTIKTLFREAVSGADLTKNQRRYLLQTLSNLKRNYTLVEIAGKGTSAAEILSNMFSTLGLKPETPKNILTDSKIREILAASKGKTGIIAISSEQLEKQPQLEKDAFGLVLRVDNHTFGQLKDRWQELGLTIRCPVGIITGGVTMTLLIADPVSRKLGKVALTMIPEELPAERKKETESHERTHRESLAIGLKQTFTGPLKTKMETREFIMKTIQQELTSYINQRDPEGMLRWLDLFLTKNNQLARISMANREMREIIDALDLIKKQAMRKIPTDELAAIIRTTPITKLRKRLEGILRHT